MARRGPAPTPTEILRLRGSWRANARKNEPRPPAGSPDCPDWLTADEQETWARLANELTSAGVLTRLDGNALARYCRLWTHWRATEDFIASYGGVKNAEPALVSTALKMAHELTRIEQEFGMTPSARSRVQAVAPSDKPDPKERFFKDA